MTEPGRGDAAAAGDDGEGRGQMEHDRPRPLLVRMGGAWLCRHELAGLVPPDDSGPDVHVHS
jgi:hypothetical protein